MERTGEAPHIFAASSASHIFFFIDTAPTSIYTLSLHDALPISSTSQATGSTRSSTGSRRSAPSPSARSRDRKSTRLNSSHVRISYAVFCLKKKKKKNKRQNNNKKKKKQ